MLVCVCARDSVAPAGRTIRYARSSPHCELKIYPYDHFDIYTGEPHAIVVRDQLDFLARTVPVSTGAARRRTWEAEMTLKIHYMNCGRFIHALRRSWSRS